MSESTTTDTETDTEEQDHEPTGDERFDPDRLFELMPERAYPRQQLILVAALRNPYVDYSTIGRMLDNVAGKIAATTVETVVMSFEQGTFGQRAQTVDAEAIEKRGGSGRLADSFDELTEKQKAMATFLAKWPLAYDELGRTTFAEAVRVTQGVPVSPTYPRNFLDNYDDFVTEYREQLDEQGELPDEKLPPIDIDSLGQNKSLEDRLRDAGANILPDDNLDIEHEADPDTPEWVVDYVESHETLGYEMSDHDPNRERQSHDPNPPTVTVNAQAEADDDTDDTDETPVPDEDAETDANGYTTKRHVGTVTTVGIPDDFSALDETPGIDADEITDRVERQPEHEWFDEEVVGDSEHQQYVLDDVLEHMRSLRDSARREHRRVSTDSAGVRSALLDHLIEYAESRREVSDE